MAENSETTSNNNVEESNNADDSTQELLKNVHVVVLKLQNEQKKFNEEMLEKMRSAEAKIEELSKEHHEIKISISDKSSGSGQNQEVAPLTKSIDNGASSATNEKISVPVAGKSFVLKNVFKNVLGMKKGEDRYSEEEEHFGVPWKIKVSRKEDHLGFYLICMQSEDAGKWSIEVNREQKLLSANGGESRFIKDDDATFESEGIYSGWGRHKFIEWEEMEKDYIRDGKLNAEVHITINKMTGIYKENLRNFDESMKEVTNVVLAVKDQKFYVLKKYLATHSPYFKTLFLGHFQESNKSVIKLSGIDSDDFQNYLEVLYSEDSINETTVEGILLVADMYDTPIVIKKCEKFLMKKTKKTLKRKLEMSTRYNLDQLKKKCLSQINSTAGIKSVLPAIVTDMDHSTIAELLEKAVEFQ